MWLLIDVIHIAAILTLIVLVDKRRSSAAQQTSAFTALSCFSRAIYYTRSILIMGAKSVVVSTVQISLTVSHT
ncbi:hypothetical protein BD408DRAFT_421584 [Parasitella parasitica]|nr:hypothetical protein BD408DRAFT_421584 [Parasitella parasitica]